MPSFICDECQATLKKAKVSSHSWQCSSRAFSCIDCSQSFNPQTVNAHTSCISEAEKYQGHLYKGNKQKQRQTGPPSAPAASAHSSLPPAAANDSEERAKKRSRVEEETKEETPLLSTDSTDVATALTAVLEETPEALSWKALQRRVAERCGRDGKEVEDDLWTAVRQQRKRMTFGRKKRKMDEQDSGH